jgi:hypothetical protein
MKGIVVESTRKIAVDQVCESRQIVSSAEIRMNPNYIRVEVFLASESLKKSAGRYVAVGKICILEP